MRERILKQLQIETKKVGELNLLGICDAHLSPHSPASWKADYFEHTKDILNQIAEYAKDFDGIVWAGDIFNLKSPVRNPLYFMSWVLNYFRKLKDNGILNCGIAGNHDLKFGSLEGLGGQPIEVLINSGLFTLLDETEVIFDAGFKTRISGASFNHGRAEACRDKQKKGSDFLLSVGHFWFGKRTGEFFNEPMFGPDFFKDSQPDAYLIGHHHEDQGIQTVGKTFYVQGSMNRTGGHDSDLTRQPGIAVIKVNSFGLDGSIFRPIVSPGEEVIDKEAKALIKKESKELDEFIRSMSETIMSSGDPLDMVNEIEEEEVRKKTIYYIQEAENGKL